MQGLLPNDDQQLDDDTLEYLLQIGAIRPEEQRVARMRSRADALRGQSYAEGKMVGGHYVKPSLGQNLSTLAGQLAGAYGGYKADQQEDALLGRRRSALEAFTSKRKKTTDPALDYGTLYGFDSDTPGY